MIQFIGYDYREEPSPNRVPVVVWDEADTDVTLEDVMKEIKGVKEI